MDQRPTASDLRRWVRGLDLRRGAPSPSVPDGEIQSCWGCKFSEKRHRWYFFEKKNPRVTYWADDDPRPVSASSGRSEVTRNDDDSGLGQLMSGLRLAPAKQPIMEPAPEEVTSATAATVVAAAVAGRGRGRGCGRRLLIVRHAYRLDEADESWVDRALRPQDSPLAPIGLCQAAALGEALATREGDADNTEPIVQVLSSPFARTVQTAAVLVAALGLQGADTLGVEPGLCEDARHMARNKLCTEPWFLPAADLCVGASSCGGIDIHYKPLLPVQHERGAQYPGRPIELPSSPKDAPDLTREIDHPGAPDVAKKKEVGGEGGAVEAAERGAERKPDVFYERCARVAHMVASDSRWKGKAVMLVTHGGVTSNIIRALTGEGVGKQTRRAGTVRHTAWTEVRTNLVGFYLLLSTCSVLSSSFSPLIPSFSLHLSGLRSFSYTQR